ncbi:hypothetical protein H0E87_020652 [Populus deltoides]|uniref:Uncharacterized protein n=1 Tax=Populus deltoides TaxID=3696 RepID=A0A8T2XLD8_POPDE|nr:hypothetical protein H0E87_020652 [Populus deltoides]
MLMLLWTNRRTDLGRTIAAADGLADFTAERAIWGKLASVFGQYGVFEGCEFGGLTTLKGDAKGKEDVMVAEMEFGYVGTSMEEWAMEVMEAKTRYLVDVLAGGQARRQDGLGVLDVLTRGRSKMTIRRPIQMSSVEEPSREEDVSLASQNRWDEIRMKIWTRPRGCVWAILKREQWCGLRARCFRLGSTRTPTSFWWGGLSTGVKIRQGIGRSKSIDDKS